MQLSLAHGAASFPDCATFFPLAGNYLSMQGDLPSMVRILHSDHHGTLVSLNFFKITSSAWVVEIELSAGLIPMDSKSQNLWSVSFKICSSTPIGTFIDTVHSWSWPPVGPQKTQPKVVRTATGLGIFQEMLCFEDETTLLDECPQLQLAGILLV